MTIHDFDLSRFILRNDEIIEVDELEVEGEWLGGSVDAEWNKNANESTDDGHEEGEA